MDRRHLRKLLFRVHAWLGLNLCLVLGVIFATGTLLLFSPELKNLHTPHLWVTPAPAGTPNATTGEIYDAMIAEERVLRIDVISAQSRPWFGRTVIGSGPGGRVVAQVDTHTAELLGFGGESRLRNIIRRIHDTLLIPITKLAHIVVNFLSFVVLAMITTGLVTYRRFWKGYLRLPQPNADQRTRKGALHRLFGVWVAPFLIASALASSVFFANAVGWEIVSPAVNPMPERADRLPENFDGAALDSLVDECRALVPGLSNPSVNLPFGNSHALRVNGIDAEKGSIFGRVTCHMDPSGTAPIQVVRTSDGNSMSNIHALAVAVHYGIWGGWVSLALWTLGGVGSVFLVLTGAQVYASRINQVEVSTGGTPARGTVAVFISGLGIVKWGYVLLVLGIGAGIVAKALL